MLIILSKIIQTHQNIHFDVLMFCLLINTTKHIYLCTFLSLYLRSREKEKYEKKERTRDRNNNHYALTGILFYFRQSRICLRRFCKNGKSRAGAVEGGKGKGVN